MKRRSAKFAVSADVGVPPCRRCLVVLGMHRSGTSALTRVLNLLGCDLPRDLVKPLAGDNDLGFWEPQAVVDVNAQILASAQSSWLDWQSFNPDWYGSTDHARLADLARSVLVEQYGASDLFVLKDPRICRLTRFWFEVLQSLDVAPLILIPIRHPDEVAASLSGRQGFDPAFSHLLWLRHVLDAEACSRGRRRCFTTYQQLMTDWAGMAGRVSDALDLGWPPPSDRAAQEIEAFLSDRYRHHRYDDAQFITDKANAHWLRDAYRIFESWAQDGENTVDHDRLDTIQRELDAASAAFGGLVKRGRLAAQAVKQLAAKSEEQEMELMSQSEELKAVRAASKPASKRQRWEGHGATSSPALDALAASDVESSEDAQVVNGPLQEPDNLADALALLARANSEKAAMEQRLAIELSQREEKLADVEAKLADATANEMALRKRAKRAQSALAARETEVQEAAQRLEAQLDDRDKELADLRSQLAQAQSALMQRRAEADDAGEKLAELQAQWDFLSTRYKKSRRLLKKRDEELLTSQDRADAAFAEIVMLTQLLRVGETKLQAMIDQGEADKMATDRRFAEMEQNAAWRIAQLEEIAARDRGGAFQAQSELQLEIAGLRLRIGELVELGREQVRREEELGDALVRASDELTRSDEGRAQLQELLAQSTGDRAALDKNVRMLTTDKTRLQSETIALRQGLSRSEIEKRGLQVTVHQQGATLMRAEKHVSWYGDLATMLVEDNIVKQGFIQRLKALFRRDRLDNKLQKRGLFNALSYLEKNPDVAASGMHPLQHYVVHGLREGRPGGEPTSEAGRE